MKLLTDMKKYLTILFLIVAIGVNAQTMIKVKSKNLTLADSIWMPKYGKEIVNIPANVIGDTVRSVDFIYHATSDTTINFPIEIHYYNKSGMLMSSFTLYVPASQYLKWTALETKLFNFIFTNTRKLQQQN